MLCSLTPLLGINRRVTVKWIFDAMWGEKNPKPKQNPLKPFSSSSHTAVDAPMLHFTTTVRCLCRTREISIHQTLCCKSLLLHSGSQSFWASTHTHTLAIASEPIDVQVNPFCGKFLALSHYLFFEIVLCFFLVFFFKLIRQLIWVYECIHLHSYK